LIDRLSYPDAAFFVHIDAKVDISQFSEISRPSVCFTQRIPVYWAEFTGVRATLLLLEEAASSSPAFDYFVLLSGSDYPLHSARYIQRFFERHRGSEFISLAKVPAPGKPLSRINTVRFPSTKPVRRFAARALAKAGLATRDYRDHLGDLEVYSGNTWWALSREAVEYIIQFHKGNPHVARFFENVFAPEEAFIHTILGNSHLKMRVRRNLLYEDWSEQGAHPKMIDDAHVTAFERQAVIKIDDGFGDGELLFARKFEDSQCRLLNRIDQMIVQEEALSRLGGATSQL